MNQRKKVLGISLLVLPLSAFAQLEEVVVTAQKRSESVQDVPITMQAVTQEQIDKLGIKTATDITKIAPNINISTQNPVSSAIAIRGVGTNDFFGNSAGSVGIYMDEVTMSAPSLGSLGLFDMERVEVLRGPQNTLFGRNTTGGAVNYISRKPDIGGEKDAYIELNVGNYGLVELSAAGTIQTGEKSALRFAGRSYNRDGLYDNLADGGDDIGEKDRWSLRTTWAWEPSERTLVSGNVHYGKEDSEVTPYKFTGRRTEGGSPNFFTQFPGPAFNDASISGEADWTTNYGGTNSQGVSVDTTNWSDVNVVGYNDQKVEAIGAYLKIEHDFEFATLTSITSFDSSETSFQLDFGGPGAASCAPGTDAGGICVGPGPLSADTDGFAMFNAQDSENDQWSQELRLISSGDGAFRWIAGLYYFYEESLLSQNMGFGLFGFDTDQPLDPNLVAEFGGPPWPGQPVGGSFGLLALSASANGYSNQAGFNIADLENEVISPYFRTEFDLTDTLTMTFGVRYTKDTKSTNSIHVGNVDTSSLGTNAFRSKEAIENLQQGLGDCSALGPNPITGTNQGSPCVSNVTRPDLEFTGVGGKLGLDYRFSDDVLVYGHYSRGFRSGKYDIEFFHGPNTGFDIVDLDEETLDAFELGIKTTLFSNTLELNAALFHYVWNDQQLFDVNPLTGPTFINVEESNLSGMEIEFKWAPGSGWYAQGGLGFLDTEIKKQGDDPDTGGPNDLIELGHQLPNAPEFSYNLIVGKDFELRHGLLSIQANIDHRDESKTAQTERSTTDEYDSFTGVGLRADYYFGESQQYQVSVYGENLTSEEVCLYELDVAAFSGTNYCLPNEGDALYGLTLRANF